MAKVRVYELAKEMSLESKELVEKLKTGGLDIKNYMSTLDDLLVDKARAIVSGVESKTVEVEEKRIKPRVIRRRKKAVEVEPEAPEIIPEESAVEPLSEEPADDKIEEPVAAAEEVEVSEVKAEEITEETAVAKEPEAEETESKPKAKAKPKKTEEDE